MERLCHELRHRGVAVWLDREKIRPGERWQVAIRRAIEAGASFIACFSAAYSARANSYMNVELNIAVEQLRLMPAARTWFIPGLFEGGVVPDKPIGGGETLRDFQWVDLAQDWNGGVRRILTVVVPEGTSPQHEPSADAPKIETQVLLFADVVGSTQLAEKYDPEEYFEILRRLQMLVSRVVKENMGQILTYIGDGFLASFNLAHQAVDCSLAIQEELNDADPRIGLNLRVGIASGPVSQLTDGLPIGIAANLAARLCSIAGGGEVVIAESVRLLGVGPQVRLKELGPQTLKGFAEPVHVYQAELVVPGFSRSSTQKSGLDEQRPSARKS